MKGIEALESCWHLLPALSPSELGPLTPAFLDFFLFFCTKHSRVSLLKPSSLALLLVLLTNYGSIATGALFFLDLGADDLSVAKTCASAAVEGDLSTTLIVELTDTTFLGKMSGRATSWGKEGNKHLGSKAWAQALLSRPKEGGATPSWGPKSQRTSFPPQF